jgi:hypothetical protein
VVCLRAQQDHKHGHRASLGFGMVLGGVDEKHGRIQASSLIGAKGHGSGVRFGRNCA